MDIQNMPDLNDLELVRVPFIVKDIDKMIRTHKISSDDEYTLLKSNKDDNASVKILITKVDDYSLIKSEKDKKTSVQADHIKVEHSPYFICPSCGEKSKQLYYPTEIIPEESREWLCKDCTCDPSIFKYGNVIYNEKQMEEYKKNGTQKPFVNIVAIDEEDLAVQSK